VGQVLWHVSQYYGIGAVVAIDCYVFTTWISGCYVF